MKCSLGISNFLNEISSLSHSVVFLYFFALIAEEGFLISPCYSLELCIQMGISFLFSLPFASLLFTAICKASPDSHFAFLHFFSMGMVLIPVSSTMSQTSSNCQKKYISLKKMFFLNYVNETMYLTWRSVFLQGMTIVLWIQYILPRDNSSPVIAPCADMYVGGENPGATLSALRCFFYL